MTKQETASYLVSLISIMESKEDAGIARGTTLATEYNKVYDNFHDLLKKEHEDEKERTDRSRNEPGGRGADRSSAGREDEGRGNNKPEFSLPASRR